MRFNRGSDGATFVMASAIIVVLLGLAAVVINRGYLSIGRSELQAISDASAHGGAATLCSSRECFEKALLTAQEIIRQQLGKYDLSDIDFHAPGPTWEGREFTITIERGRWWPPGGYEPPREVLHEKAPFEPLDLSGELIWEAVLGNQGIPSHVAANAFFVRIERKDIGSLLSVFGLARYSLDAQSYAVAGGIEELSVAPFALPICALLNELGEYDPSYQCQFDRSFTAANRYCPLDEDGRVSADCNLVPGAHYVFETWEYCERSGIRPSSCNEGLPMKAKARDTFWNRVEFQDLADHFGVIGLPGEGDAVTETEIRSLFNPLQRGMASARIGDRFRVLSGGLVEPLTDAAIWDQISNRLVGDHREVRETDFPTLLHVFRFSPQNNLFLEARVGTCNSRRVPLLPGPPEGVPPSAGWPEPATWCGQNLSEPLYGTNFSFWEVPIPVIAEVGPGASPCRGVTGAEFEPRFNPSGTYVIVGFTKLSVFDTDIGNLPPVVNSAPCESEDPDECRREGCEPYAFSDLGGNPIQCNMIRARTRCDASLIPTSEQMSSRHPSIIEVPYTES